MTAVGRWDFGMAEQVDFRSVLVDHCARRRSTAETMRLLHIDSVEDLVTMINANRLVPLGGRVHGPACHGFCCRVD
jgi:hypothetical protein